MASNQLNAGAASFTPGGPAPTAAMPPSLQDSFTESFNDYADMVDSIEEEIDADGLNESFTAPPSYSGGSGVSGIPAHMVKHANEFWFPESRDCSCCNGFKHGCRCAPSNGNVCAACSSSPPPRTSFQPASVPPPKAQQHYGSNSRQQQVCKFYRSPGGCRFGEKCRFLHA